MALTRTAAPTFLELDLFGPGMGPFHRAGLGGMACALRYIEQNYDILRPDQIPGHPWKDMAPWNIERDRIRIDFGAPERAGEYLERLFQTTFQIADGFIYLPCLFRTRPSQEVLAEYQRGFILTFLQHGKTRELAKEEMTISFDLEPGHPPISVDYRPCFRYKHQDLWQLLVDKQGRLCADKEIEITGPTLPGAVVRHNAYPSDTKVSEPPGRFLALCFSLVGTLSLPVHKVKAILLVPEVTDLTEFAEDRPLMSPRNFRELRAAGEGDAVLQALLRLRASKEARVYELPGFYSMAFESTPWASQQKSRVSTLQIRRGLSEVLAQFQRAWEILPNRLVAQKDGSQSFLKDSLIRPLFAQNLAMERPFYEGFTDLVITSSQDIAYERKGLSKFMESAALAENSSEAIMVRAVHLALRGQYAMIAHNTEANPVGMRKRFKNEYDRWRLAFSGAKTADQFRHHLCDLLSRGGSNRVLRESWLTILPELVGPKWRLGRDLVLLALCSYAGRETESEGTETEGEGDNQ